MPKRKNTEIIESEMDLDIQEPEEVPVDVSGKMPIRRMDLTSEQKKMLVHDELKRILNIRTDGITGGSTQACIRTPEDETELCTHHIIFDKDARIMQMAWDFYKDNAENPTVKKFVNECGEIIGERRVFRRVVMLNLN